MKYKSIFIANLAEIAKPITDHMNPIQKAEEIFEDHAYCDRFVLSDKDNRVLITPLVLDSGFCSDIEKMLKFRNICYLTPKSIGESICQAILNDKNLFLKLKDIIYQNPQISIGSYSVTPEFKNLLDILKKEKLKFKVEGFPSKGNIWTASFFDSKAGFRQATYSLRSEYLKMPRGVICTKKNELIGWMRYFIKKGNGIVLKSNRGLAGAGLVIIHKNELSTQDVPKFVRHLFQKGPFWPKEPIVVEEYITPNLKQCGGAPNIEMVIENGSFHFLYVCGMRVSKKGVFKGIEFGKGAVSSKIHNKLKRSGEIFGTLLKTCGYNGHFEIDFVYGGADNRLYPIEANLRRTGGTHAYEFTKRLLGSKFSKDYYIVSMNKTNVPKLKNKDYLQVKKIIRDIFYPMNGKSEGVIISTVNYLKKGKLGYVIVGPNKQRVYEIEKILLKKIQY